MEMMMRYLLFILGGVLHMYGGTWSGPTNLSGTLTHSQDGIGLGIDQTGNGVAVWVDDYNDRVYANYWNGSEWTDRELINDYASDTSHFHFVLNAAGEGIYCLTMTENIFLRQYDGSEWSLDTVIEYANNSQISINENGRGGVAYSQNTTPGQSDGAIYAAFYNPESESWILPSTQVSEADHYCANPVISLNNSGDAGAAWGYHVDSTYSIQLAWYSSGAWQTSTTIYTGDRAQQPNLVLNNNGKALLQWFTDVGAKAVWYDGTAFGSVHTLVSYETNVSQIALNDENTGFIVTSYWDGLSDKGVQAVQVIDGVFADPILLSSGIDNPHNPSVQLLDQGGALVTFMGDDGVYACEYNGKDWGTPTLISSGLASATSISSVALGVNGQGGAIWGLPSGSTGYVYANIYTPSSFSGSLTPYTYPVKTQWYIGWNSLPEMTQLRLYDSATNALFQTLNTGNGGQFVPLPVNKGAPLYVQGVTGFNQGSAAVYMSR